MGRTDDLTSLLGRWEFDEKHTVRRVRADDGREIIQVRLPLGIEQYEINGRPDGKRPEGFESWLHHYQNKARVEGDAFILNGGACERLQSEGMLYYYRYLLFFQISEYTLCIRDTARNIRLLDFVTKHAARRQGSESLEQYRPYILRMNIMARTLLRVKERGDIRGAIERLERGIETIQNLPPLPDNPIFSFEKERSIKSIEELIRQFRSQLPVSRRDLLQRQMRDAIAKEDYEKAASLRDQLRKLLKR